MTALLPRLSVLSLLLVACSGSKITTDATLDDTGSTGGNTDGGTADGGADGGGDGGTDGGGTGTDADADGWTVEAGDCDDSNDTVYPGAPDECYDGVDANCDEEDDDDCDGDGYYPEELGGDDCDDDDSSINPGASESRADGKDSDCDGDVDEDAYCNVYAPMSNASSSYRTYDTNFYDGATYIESNTLSSYNESASTVTLSRVLDDGAGGGMTINESWACASDGTVTVSGYTVNTFGFDIANNTFSPAAKRVLPQGDLVEGATWEISYTAVDGSTGSASWTVTGTATVLPQDNITVIAGIFATVPVQVDYDLVDNTGFVGDRSGVVTWYLAPGVGVIYSLDVLDDGSTSEERELVSYGGFYAMDPDDFSGEGGGGTDGGTSDGGTSDGGTSDGGTSDGGTSDGGTSDGGTTGTE